MLPATKRNNIMEQDLFRGYNAAHTNPTQIEVNLLNWKLHNAFISQNVSSYCDFWDEEIKLWPHAAKKL